MRIAANVIAFLKSRFPRGSGEDIVAGPVALGRTMSAETEAELWAEISAWSRSRGSAQMGLVPGHQPNVVNQERRGFTFIFFGSEK